MSKVLNMLGLATRARKVTNGEELTLEAIKKNQVQLVFLASDAGDSTKKRIENKCKSKNIPLVTEFTKIELSMATGALNRVVIGVMDSGFRKRMLELL
ncbi:L7Ae/L30e/S12e/Gadd45 family ribosomal protein [Phocicoccus pinnipedialis]|uniref:Putative ribosomal protein YlxQ n=1 Tax=Phocicoccus pinnipedialis TaxID=110845 RepID=A0A6V7RFI6_9BACL|nr:ribosomal L7Ae/L30e/S12e/Gadd45 family protein [Jeotgalicoccus pinnipedialis]MBP1939122.1 ribosomal protein L7Ae-like RNA K-turn-binding protein [Jeotgalicoccus pinnipedialis]CAD2076711.1 putative ribosomal protein YlxQ [Jeotgalicoccus pinnipedialis]